MNYIIVYIIEYSNAVIKVECITFLYTLLNTAILWLR